MVLFSSVGFQIKKIKDDLYFSMIYAKSFVTHFRTNQQHEFPSQLPLENFSKGSSI